MKFDVAPHETWVGFYKMPNAIAALNRIKLKLSQVEFYPLPEDVLRFMTVDLSKVRYVLVGQDPYSSYDEKDAHPQATGRSFEVYELIGKTWDYKFKQRSLQNIIKAVYFEQTGKVATIDELRKLIMSGSFALAPPSAWFDSLEKQGVLFLNATLTVPPNSPGEHHELWKCYRQRIVEYIEKENPRARWVIWGNDAEKLIGDLLSPQTRGNAITRCHPRLDRFVQDSGMGDMTVDWTGLS